MSENMENSTPNAQENSEKSENIQENSELNTENNDNSSNEGDGSPENEEKGEKSSNDGDELEIPEPDIVDEEGGKKKKEQPEWLKKKLERDRRKEAEKEASLKAEAEQLRQENLRLRNGGQPENPQNPQNQQPHVDPYMPRREQFNSDGEYFLALGDYRDQRRNAEAAFHQRQQAIKKHETEFQNKLKDAIDTGKTKYKDFDERTDYILYGEGFPSNRAMAEAIVDSDYKDDILYFLGTHTKEAERIANLNPVSAAKEIAKIEVRLASKRKSNISKAPKPLTPVGKGSGGSGTHKNPENMDMDEFRQWYNDKYGAR